jgi:flagellum-specific ATP synthase
MSKARQALARYADMEELIRVGAYRIGTDPEVDASVRFFKEADAFLSQQRADKTPADTSFAEVYRMLLEAGVDDPLAQPVPMAG